MGLREWILDVGDAETAPARMGAYGVNETDDSGAPIVQYSPQMVSLLKLSTGFSDLAHIYKTQHAVRTCVNFLSTNIGQLGIRVYKQDGEEQTTLRDHPLTELLNRPNPNTTRYQLIRGTMADLAIYDNAFWLKKFARLGSQSRRQRSIYRIPAWAVTPKGGSWITGPEEYWVNVGAGTSKFKAADIVHFHGYNPVDPRIGSSPLEALRNILYEESASSEHRVRFYENSARIEGIIQRPASNPTTGTPKWTSTQRKSFLKKWRESFTGSHNAGKTGLLEDGMTWNPASFSPKDSEFIAGREFALDTVATEYAIPLAVLSRNATPTFASMKEFRTMLYVDTFGPWNSTLEGTIALQLISEFEEDDLYAELNIQEKLQGDFGQQVETLRNASQVPHMAVNEARKKMGLAPIDDERYDVPARPANFNYGEDDDATDQPADGTPGVQPPVKLAPAAAAASLAEQLGMTVDELAELDVTI